MRGLLGCCALLLATRVEAAPVDDVIKTAPGCDAKRTHCFGIALHVAVGDAGPIATADWIAAQVTNANRHFELLDTEFRIISVDAQPASVLRVEDRKERDQLAKLATGRVIHVVITGQLDDVDTPGNEIGGVAWRSAGSVKLVILSTKAWDRTLAHELGHVFGLPHSTYPISIMNKSERKDPPQEQRTFDPKEVAAMKPRIAYVAKSKILEDRR
jgi:hypothetical protein